MSGAARRLFFLWAPVALTLAYEVYLSSQSDLPASPVTFSNVDKVLHGGYFFLMASLAYRALRFGHGWTRGRAALAVVLGFLAYGLVDEWHQSFVPRRESDLRDVAADVAGAALAALVSEAIWRRLEPGSG